MSQTKIDILERALFREKSARKQAEKILEDKSTELYHLSRELSIANTRLENSIQEKKSQLKGVFENINDAYVVMDIQGFVLKMNDAAIELLGYDYRLEKINLIKLVHEEDSQKTKEGFQDLYKNGAITNFQITIITKNKTHKIVQINASIVFDNKNIPIAAQGIIRDVTKDIEAQNNLIASESRLSTLILNLSSGVVLVDKSNNIVLANTKILELFSLKGTPDELVGLQLPIFAEKNKNNFEDPSLYCSRLKEITSRQQIVLADELFLTNGKILERDYIPVHENNQYRGHLWSYRDVTLQRKYSQNIEKEKHKYSNIIANMNLGLLEVDTEDKILMVNQSFVDMSGYTEDELLGKVPLDIFVSKKKIENSNTENSNRVIGESNSHELEVMTKSGEKRSWLISSAPNYNLNGEIIGSIRIYLDVTIFRNLERQQEILFEKLERSNNELEEYAHIVSHDLKSPLRSLNALTSWLKEDNEGKFDEMSLKNFELIDKTLEKMEVLISEILDYSSISSEEKKKEKVDLNEVIEGLHHVLYIPKHIELTVKNKLPTIKGDATRFQQLFLNIISNAVRYIDKEKGIVEVDVKELSTHYQFSIRDNGVGIAEKDFDKIFKIFQALTDHKESSGIGLSIVKKIINLYEGKIWLESEVGVGTTFYFTILK